MITSYLTCCKLVFSQIKHAVNSSRLQTISYGALSMMPRVRIKVRSSKLIIIRFFHFSNLFNVRGIFHIYKPGFLIAIYRDSDRCSIIILVISKNLVNRVS